MVNAIDQPSFDACYAWMESLLVKALNSKDNSTELQFPIPDSRFPFSNHRPKDGDCLCFVDIIVKIKELLTPERKMINEVITVCKVILVNPATSAAGERSFSTAQRLKTWLRSTMTQERFSNLTILNSHKERTDRLSLLEITNEFTDRNSNRKRNFCIFKSDAQ